MEGINNIYNHQKIKYDNRPSRANMQFFQNSIWFAKMKNSYKILTVTADDLDLINNCILSTGFCGIQCTEKFPLSLAFSIIISDSFTSERNNNSVGTTMMSINNNTFRNIKVPKLEKEEIMNFNQNYDIYIKKLSSLRLKIANLISIKNILLNKYF
ncbi:restriction endonuclease subunit S [Mycoplasma miroungirhinis]|uniref:Type I restriction modification DNA specificity domain-containing protein n=1 Tax=Mycoplasma miroungirhinis TaxID=754516 RepID=A0A6M4JGK4_9MOLU|nr:hypothetical protein [Mycoplasma miroungirhinis]QJR44162.1 hypothetical protein HLA92_01810 [Mycoplasma miroungirhinis]